MTDLGKHLKLVRDILDEAAPATPPAEMDREEAKRRYDALSRVHEALEYDLLPQVQRAMFAIEPAVYELEKTIKVLPPDCPVRKGVEKLILARKDSLYGVWFEMEKIYQDLQKLQREAGNKSDDLIDLIRED